MEYGSIYDNQFRFFSILVAALFWTAFLERGEGRKYIVISGILMLLLFGIRFVPWISGAEWRCFIRNALNYIISLTLILWGCFLLKRYKYSWRSLLAICAFIISGCMLFYQQEYRPKDCIRYQGSIPEAIMEVTDNDSMGRYDYYEYINSVLRGKESDNSLQDADMVNHWTSLRQTR